MTPPIPAGKPVSVIDPPERIGTEPVRFVLHGRERGGTDETRQREHAFCGQSSPARADEFFRFGSLEAGYRVSLEIDDVGNVGAHECWCTGQWINEL